MIQYIKNIWAGLATTFIGMRITFKHLFVKKVTIQYPNERFPLPENTRNRLLLDMTRCNACRSCSTACPVNCISIESVRVMPDDPDQEILYDGSKRKLWLTRYDIDFAKCCYCGLCQAACPTNAINHTKEFEYSSFNRESLLYKFQTLTPEQVVEKEQMYADFQAKDKVCKTTEAAKAAEKKVDDKSAE